MARRESSETIGAQTSTDPILYTQRIQNSGPNGYLPPIVPPATASVAYAFDYLWGFPTLGYMDSTRPRLTLFGNTLRADSTAPNNNALIMLGNIGNPVTVTRFRIGGTLALTDANFTQVGGLFNVVFFDALDKNSTNLTIASAGDGTNAIYTIQINAPATGSSNLGTYSFDITAAGNQVKIADFQGRFGMLIGAIDDTTTTTDPSDAQWYAIGGVANGENGGYLYDAPTGNATAFVNTAPGADNPSDSFNYGAIDANRKAIDPPINFYMALQGLALDGTTTPIRGNLTGSIRLRGIDVPANLAPEARPHQYKLSFYSSPAPTGQQFGTLVTQRSLFTQPSYDSSGALLRNFRIDGLPAGTYDLQVTLVPSQYVSGTGTGATLVSESIRQPNQYPGSDYVPAIVRNVVVTPSGPVTNVNSGTTVNLLPSRPIRLERFGDINKDGAIDFGDLSTLLLAYNAFDGEALYTQYKDADIAGGPTAEFANAGPPDGAIDFGDLSALLQYYNTVLDE